MRTVLQPLVLAAVLASCDAAVVSQSVIAETFSIARVGTSVADWQSRFPNDTIDPQAGSWDCARVVVLSRAAEEGQWSRRVAFGPPPAQARLPADTTSASLRRDCVLRSVETTLTMPSDSAVEATSAAARVGTGEGRTTGDWGGTTTWQISGATWTLSRSAPGARKKWVRAEVSVAPETSMSNGLDRDATGADTALWREALFLAGSAAGAPRAGGDAQMVGADVVAWLDGKRSASAEIRAAAFLVADLALATAQWPGANRAVRDLMAPLAALGATATEFGRCEGDDEESCSRLQYDRSLADSALVLGAGHAIGNVALAALAFTPRHRAALQSMLATAERHLGTTDTDERRLAGLQIAVADGYHVLAATEGGEPSAARVDAIRWYAAAVESAIDPATRAYAWQEWYLLRLAPPGRCVRYMLCT